jgi:hypothetical protein
MSDISARRRHFIPLALLLATSASAAAPQQATGPAPGSFDMLRFFEGRTEGAGTLSIVMRSAQTMRVQSIGRRESDGSLTLRQTIKEGAKRPRVREWRIRELGQGGYTGTLTDATGPVNARTEGGRLRIRYEMKGGLDVEQWLVPQPGGRSLANEMRVRKFGLVVARVEETIRKLD